MLHTLTVTRIKNKIPFEGKLRVVLRGSDKPFMRECIFFKGKASVPLVPSSELGENTYYKYQIFPQGHAFGIYLYEPIEANLFLMPDRDADIDEIVPYVPPQQVIEKIIPNPYLALDDIKEKLEDMVDKSSDQTITGKKEFTQSPTVPTPTVDSDADIPATTRWVKHKIASELQEPTLVHFLGKKVSLVQLPSSPREGDIWFVETKDSFYVYHEGWRCLPIGRQADTIENLPTDPVELAAFKAMLSEGAHLTIIK